MYENGNALSVKSVKSLVGNKRNIKEDQNRHLYI